MKKNVLILGAVFLVGSSVFGQDVKQIPNFSSEAEKAAWIQAHPTDYERLSGEKVTNTVPEFKTQAEKDAWIEQSKPKKEAEPTTTQIEAAISTEAEKDAYLREHPNTVYMTQEEFNALPDGKKASVLADENYVIIK
jgi:hypothetical protein